MKPTKSNLLDLEDKLDFVEKGKDFLDYKRTQLVDQIRNIWTNYKNQHKKSFGMIQEAMSNLNESYKEQGKQSVNLISMMGRIQYKPRIELKYSKKMGIAIPRLELEFEKEEKLPPYSFTNTSKHLDNLMRILKNMFEQMILLAETEDVLIKYAFNFQKVNRRIQGLKNVIKPQIESDIKKIERILEETERENFTRLKKTKDMIKTKEKNIW
ncbi:MAG: V-type ATP synthase subunit D [Promethearchaeati archaeon]